MLFVIVTATQVTFGLLVFHAEKQSSIKTKKGILVYVVNWFAVLFSIAASSVWFIYCRKSSKKNKNVAGKGNKNVEAAYKYKEVKGDGDEEHSPKGRVRGQTMDALHAHRAGHDPRFEPFRLGQKK